MLPVSRAKREESAPTSRASPRPIPIGGSTRRAMVSLPSSVTWARPDGEPPWVGVGRQRRHGDGGAGGALDLEGRRPGRSVRRVTPGADKAYDVRHLVADYMRATSRRIWLSTIDQRTRLHTGHGVPQHGKAARTRPRRCRLHRRAGLLKSDLTPPRSSERWHDTSSAAVFRFPITRLRPASSTAR
jgi:hypothetical protein